MLILVGAGQPGAQRLPYHPLIQALRSQTSVLDWARAALTNLHRTTTTFWLAELQRLLPELRVAATVALPLPLQTQRDEARVRLFEALFQCLQGVLAESQPTLLCLDNLHWADSATLDWLAFLGSRLRQLPLLVVGAYRTEEAELLTDLRYSLTQQGVLSEVEMGGLSGTEVAQLIHQLFGAHKENAQLVERLCTTTGGNPFFLLQIAQALLDQGLQAGRWGTLTELPLPATISAAVRMRLAALNPVALQVLEAGAN